MLQTRLGHHFYASQLSLTLPLTPFIAMEWQVMSLFGHGMVFLVELNRLFSNSGTSLRLTDHRACKIAI